MRIRGVRRRVHLVKQPRKIIPAGLFYIACFVLYLRIAIP